jgi:hypothetical protein
MGLRSQPAGDQRVVRIVDITGGTANTFRFRSQLGNLPPTFEVR